MKIHLFDEDPRARNGDPSYLTNHGSFSSIIINLNRTLQKMGLYAEPDEADVVGGAGSLSFDFKHKDKPSFLIHVWETLNAIPLEFRSMVARNNQNIFSLSKQTQNLWRKMGIEAPVVYGGCDTDFWKPTVPKNPDAFQFVHVTNTNVRSGLDQALIAFAKAFAGNKKIKLVIKDSNDPPNPILLERIAEMKKYCNIEYLNGFWTIEQMRDLYSASHACLNVLRITSFGLPLLECSACESLCITGDIPATNELISEENGALLSMSRTIPMHARFNNLQNYWGLANWYPNLTYLEEPAFAEYDIDEYAWLLNDVVRRYESHWSKLPMRKHVIQNWSWRRSAEMLVANVGRILS